MRLINILNNRSRCVLLAVISLLSCQATLANATEDLSLYKGQVKVLQVGEIDRVAVGDGKVVSTSILKNGQLIVLAEGVGTSALHIWTKLGRQLAYKINVVENDADVMTREVTSILNGYKGIRVRSVGGKTLVEGTASASVKKIIGKIAGSFPGIIDLTQESKVTTDKMISMLVQITEINTNELNNLGIDWDTTIAGPAAGIAADALKNSAYRVYQSDAIKNFNLLSGGTLDNIVGHGYFGITSAITSRINLLVSSGYAYMLAQPRLSAKSGGSASFLAGGEVPLPTQSNLGSTNVEFKKYGIVLNIKPVADNEGNIQAHVETEVSAVDPSVTVKDIPGFLTRTTSTDISMRDGQTMVISGLVDESLSSNNSGLAWLKDIPILGALFRSKNFRNKKTELVIFVTPTIYNANSALNKQALARGKALQKKLQESLRNNELVD